VLAAAQPHERLVTVKKMRCDHCRGAVKQLLQSYPQVTAVTPVDNETFRVEGVLPETLAADITKLGFELAE
jgi:copper chaperone CopZ